METLFSSSFPFVRRKTFLHFQNFYIHCFNEIMTVPVDAMRKAKLYVRRVLQRVLNAPNSSSLVQLLRIEQLIILRFDMKNFAPTAAVTILLDLSMNKFSAPNNRLSPQLLMAQLICDESSLETN